MNGEISFSPDAVCTIIYPGDTVLDAALGAGVPLEHECGGNCACTTCQVQVISGMQFLSAMEEVERLRLLDAENVDARSRLACQAIFNPGAAAASVSVQRMHTAESSQLD
jgi:ferredoxin